MRTNVSTTRKMLRKGSYFGFAIGFLLVTIYAVFIAPSLLDRIERNAEENYKATWGESYQCSIVKRSDLQVAWGNSARTVELNCPDELTPPFNPFQAIVWQAYSEQTFLRVWQSVNKETFVEGNIDNGARQPFKDDFGDQKFGVQLIGAGILIVSWVLGGSLSALYKRRQGEW